jgi:hypothetical protein
MSEEWWPICNGEVMKGAIGKDQSSKVEVGFIIVVVVQGSYFKDLVIPLGVIGAVTNHLFPFRFINLLGRKIKKDCPLLV